MYQHTTLPYAVHAFYRQCNKKGNKFVASCNCAVAVKVEDDVVIIDKCGPSRSKEDRATTIKMIKNGEVHSGLTVQQYDEGNQYHVRCCVRSEDLEMVYLSLGFYEKQMYRV